MKRSIGDSLDRLGDRDGQQGRAVLRAACEDGVDQRGAQARPGRVVDRDELAAGVDHLESPGDRVGALGAALDHLDVHERDAGPVAPLEQLAVLRRDRQDDLGRRRRD